MSPRSWKPLGETSPGELVDARLQIHHAAQLVAAVGQSLLEPREDDSHPNLGWLPERSALAGHRIPGERPFQAALVLAELRLLLLDGDGAEVAGLSLAGQTLERGLAWLSGEIEKRFGRALPGGLATPGYELPAHAVAEGAAFGAPGGAHAELARWYDCADAELTDLAARTEGASEVRCWPHHFDLATLVWVERGADEESSRTVGIGLSPGDESYPEPYWYVSPWPYPEDVYDEPLASGGHWHREGFTGAILTAGALLGGGPAAEQPARLRAFLASAVAAARRAVDR